MPRAATESPSRLSNRQVRQHSAGSRWHAAFERRRTLLLSLAGAVLMWAALPPLDLGWLGWVAPMPWLLLIRQPALSGRKPYQTLWLAGLGFWLAAIHWLRLPAHATIAGWLALSFYLSFYLPVFVGLGRVGVHRLGIPLVLAAPAVWTGLELARGHLLTGFTMASLGHTQYRWIEVIQLSDLVGGYGVSFLVMFVAACLARMWPLEGRRWTWWPAIPLTVAMACALIYGHWRTDRAAAGPIARIALIQGTIDTTLNPPADIRERMHGQYRQLTEEAIAKYGKVDLVVWPETSFGYSLLEFDRQLPLPSQGGWTRAGFDQAARAMEAQSRWPLEDLARRSGTNLLVGIDVQRQAAEGVKRFNSATLANPQGQIVGRYEKMHLVLFGEYVPWADRLAWLERLMRSLCVSVTPGGGPRVFELATATGDVVRIAPNICYETVIPHLIRRHVNTLAGQGREPDVLVNLTNDGWFWGSSELDMHLACGVFRAIECRKPLVIAANTGFSASIDGDGRILAQGPRRQAATLLAQVARDGRRSLYLAYGDWFAGLGLGFGMLLAGVGLWDRWRAIRAVR